MTGVRTHDRILDAAEQLVREDAAGDDGTWAAAIVLTAAACETASSYAIARLYELDQLRATPRLRGPDLRELRRLLKSKKTINLKPKRQRRIWQTLSNDKLSRWPEWIRYVRHIDDCNAIAHSGLLSGRRVAHQSDATEALKITHAFHQHLQQVIRAHALRDTSSRL